MNRLALFDCDGTLVDSQHAIVAAMTHSFAEMKLEPPSRQAILGVVGLSLEGALRRLVPGADEAFISAMRGHFRTFNTRERESRASPEPLYDGIADLIARLDAEGWMLGIATGKSDRGLAHILHIHGIARHFVTLQTADRHPSKPHPAMALQAIAEAGATPRTTVVIGDTSFDIEMARNAGARALGVAWGYHAPAALHAAGAHAVALDMDDLARHIAAHEYG